MLFKKRKTKCEAFQFTVKLFVVVITFHGLLYVILFTNSAMLKHSRTFS